MNDENPTKYVLLKNCGITSIYTPSREKKLE